MRDYRRFGIQLCLKRGAGVTPQRIKSGNGEDNVLIKCRVKAAKLKSGISELCEAFFDVLIRERSVYRSLSDLTGYGRADTVSLDR